MKYIRREEVVDTYGGDFTYEDEYYEVEDGFYYVTTVTYGIFRGESINETETIKMTEEEFLKYNV